jgi:hypothetical protein
LGGGRRDDAALGRRRYRSGKAQAGVMAATGSGDEAIETSYWT